MKVNRVIVSLLAVVAILATSCSSSVDEPQGGVELNDDSDFVEVESLNLTAAEKSLALSSNQFALNMMRQLAAEAANENLLMSPLSLSEAMGMTANGAHNATLDEIMSHLWPSATLEQVNGLYEKLAADIAHLDGQVTLSHANSLWLSAEYELLPGYSAIMTDVYHAGVFGDVIFGSAAAQNAISKWADEATKSNIKDFGSSIKDSSIKVALLNALYFNGKWTIPFDEKETIVGGFTNADGQVEQVAMMTTSQTHQYSQYCDLDVTAVKLPYGNGKYYLELVKPENNVTIADALALLAAGRLEQIDQEIMKTICKVMLPRFKVKGDCLSLKDAMTRQGISLAFTHEADFGNMCAKPLMISDVLQQCTFEVNEQAATGTSATGVLMGDIEPDEEVAVEFNRPFIYLLRENESGSIIMAGLFNTTR